MNNYIYPSQYGELCKRHLLIRPIKKYDFDVFIFLERKTYNKTTVDMCTVLDIRTLQIRNISTTLLEQVK